MTNLYQMKLSVYYHHIGSTWVRVCVREGGGITFPLSTLNAKERGEEKLLSAPTYPHIYMYEFIF